MASCRSCRDLSGTRGPELAHLGQVTRGEEEVLLGCHSGVGGKHKLAIGAESFCQEQMV